MKIFLEKYFNNWGGEDSPGVKNGPSQKRARPYGYRRLDLIVHIYNTKS